MANALDIADVCWPTSEHGQICYESAPSDKPNLDVTNEPAADIQGHLKQPSPLRPPFGARSLEACMHACEANPSCLSFAYAEDKGVCHNYDENLADQGISRSEPYRTLYGRRCFSCKARNQQAPSEESPTTPTAPDPAPVPAVTSSGASSTATARPGVTCGNEGLQWAFYQDTAGPINSDKYSAFKVTSYKIQEPLFHDTTTSVGGAFSYRDSGSTGEYTAYGSQFRSDNDAPVINHRGYLVAPTTGTYTISASNVQDALWFWIGSKAFEGWTKHNAHLEAVGGGSSATYTVHLHREGVYPIRILFANPGSAGSFDFSIKSPDGVSLLDANTPASPVIIQYSCDGTEAPEFPPFGSETSARRTVQKKTQIL